MSDWIYIEDKKDLPSVDTTNRFEGFVNPQAGIAGQPFAPVIFSAHGEKMAIAGRFFCAMGRRPAMWFSLQGVPYATIEVYAWQPAPAAAALKATWGPKH